ncbi:hypothetical protein BDR03DRAFT_940868 [Suillus americanus]|nr:hypothetical protein BDR03DRAFT_940868 [Suillus americanus]
MSLRSWRTPNYDAFATRPSRHWCNYHQPGQSLIDWPHARRTRRHFASYLDGTIAI